MSQKKDCCIVIPAFNESVNISKNIDKLLKSEFDIIIVNDGSTDDTIKKIINYNIIAVHHKLNLGYDKAIETGFKKALELGYRYVITFDADGQHDYNDLNLFYNKLKEGNKLVIGKRINFQRFGEYVFALYSKKFYGINDPLCGFKGYDIEIYKENGCFNSYNSIGTELMFYCLNYKYKFCEISISINKRDDNSKFGGVFKSNFKIIVALIKTIYFNFFKKKND